MMDYFIYKNNIYDSLSINPVLILSFPSYEFSPLKNSD